MYASATCRAFVALLVGTRISCLRSIHFKCAYAAFNLKIDQSAIVSFWSGYTLAYKNAITMHAALKKTEARLWALQCDPFGNESTETLIPYRWVELPKCRATDKFELYAWSTRAWWYFLALLFVLFVIQDRGTSFRLQDFFALNTCLWNRFIQLCELLCADHYWTITRPWYVIQVAILDCFERTSMN